MAFAKSQSYKVDNRFSPAKEVSDNSTGLDFLNEYLQARGRNARFPVTSERSQDDRFIFPALSGTIPFGALPSEPRGSASIGNTDGAATFRNIFRAR